MPDGGQADVFPCVGLIVSGGHTSLYRCRGPLDFELLGATIDDAAGEAFDKVASMLGLPYPGGPAIQRAAEQAIPGVSLSPCVAERRGRLDFSFSGLKTAVRYPVAGPGKPDFEKHPTDAQQVADLAASFQEAVVDCLVGKALRPGENRPADPLRRRRRGRQRPLPTAAGRRGWQRGVELHIAPLRLCTDNAVMGAIAVERLRAGFESSTGCPSGRGEESHTTPGDQVAILAAWNGSRQPRQP